MALGVLFVKLSPREIEILDLVARGNSNKIIGRKLSISDQTVKNHVSAILRKLEVNDRTEAVVYALRNGWIRMEAAAFSSAASFVRIVTLKPSLRRDWNGQHVGDDVFVASGTTILRDVSNGALVMSHHPQREKLGWVAQWRRRHNDTRPVNEASDENSGAHQTETKGK